MNALPEIRGNRRPLFEGPEWNFDLLKKVYDVCEEIGVGEMGLSIYPNQIEVITAEQMLDAYASIGMPHMYRHWSFGKHFAREESLYRRGRAHSRLRARDQLQPLHQLRHGRKHHDHADARDRPRRDRPQPLLQEQLSVQGLDSRRRDPRLSRLRQDLRGTLRGALRRRSRRGRARQRARPDATGHEPQSDRPQGPHLGAGACSRAGAARVRGEEFQRLVANRAAHRAPRRGAGPHDGGPPERGAEPRPARGEPALFPREARPKARRLAARAFADRAHAGAILLSAAPDQDDERGLRHLHALQDHEPHVRAGPHHGRLNARIPSFPFLRRLPAGLVGPRLLRLQSLCARLRHDA